MKIFNSIQLTLLFSCYPFICQWVHGSNFYAHMILFWVLVLGYVASFCGMTYVVYNSMD